MRKFLTGLVTLIVVILAAVLILPSFVDWNEYKGDIAVQVKAATGRDIFIGGDLKLALLPTPTLSVRAGASRHSRPFAFSAAQEPLRVFHLRSTRRLENGLFHFIEAIQQHMPPSVKFLDFLLLDGQDSPNLQERK